MKKLAIIGVSVLLIMTSCGVYSPLTSDIPLISNKNDVRIDGGRSLTESVSTTLSYGLTKKIALQVSGSLFPEKKSYFQFSPGYYRNFGNRNIMEIYLGYGDGSGYAYNDAHPGTIQGKFQIYFIQCNIGRISCKFAHADLGIGIKTGYLHSTLIDQGYYGLNSDGTYIDDSAFIEPHAILRIGTENIKINFKLAGCIIDKFTHVKKWFPYFPLNMGLGLNLNF